jgi:VWFA-related protein
MKMRSLIRISVLLALSFAVNGEPLSAITPVQGSSRPQTTAQPSPSSPAKGAGDDSRANVASTPQVVRSTTRLVVVDVVATDHKDRAVEDLEAHDFTLLEDGQEQKISVFVFQHPPPPAPVSHPFPELPPGMFTNFPRYREGGALNVVLLDGLNTSLQNQAYARQQMVKFLEKLPTDRPIAVYALGQDLRLLQDFTSDPDVLKNIVKKFKGQSSHLLGDEIAPPGLSEATPADVQEALARFERGHAAFQTDLRVRFTLDALNAIARTLSGYPGRKNLIWISDGFPLHINPELDLGVESDFSATRNYNSEIGKTAEALMSSQIAIYPVDAKGLGELTFFDAAHEGGSFSGRRGGTGFGAARRQESNAVVAAHHAMDELADRTGGKAFYNRNDLDAALRKSIDDGSTYYTLAYYPSHKNWDGKFRTIQVRVKRPEVRLRHRLGYYAVDPQAYTKMEAKQRALVFGRALSLDSPASTALIFKAGVFPPSLQTRNKVLVSFAIDAQSLTFVRQPDGTQQATVECGVQAYSEKGKPVKSEIATFDAALRPESFKNVMQSGFQCQQLLDLPPASYVLRLGVIDDHTGLIGTTNAKITVPPATDDPKSQEQKQ